MQFGNAVTADGLMASGQIGIFGPFPGQQDQTQAYGISETVNAPVAVGAAINGSDPFGAKFHAFGWTPVGGLEDLGLATGDPEHRPRDLRGRLDGGR
jgi:hypothetical protein